MQDFVCSLHNAETDLLWNFVESVFLLYNHLLWLGFLKSIIVDLIHYIN